MSGAAIMLLDLGLPQETVRLSEWPFANAEPRIVPGRIAEISAGVALDSIGVPSSELSVVVSDAGARFEKLLEGPHECRRSPATLTRWSEAGESRRYTGILDRWEFGAAEPGTVTLYLTADDGPLRNSWVPHVQVLKAEWGEGTYAMPDGVAGIGAPYLYGAHNSSGVTGKGFVPLVCVGQSGAAGRYLVCFGRAKTKIGTWKADGTSISGTLQYVARGGKVFTTVNFTSGITAGLVINGDFEGYETVGDASGVLISNPVRQLRHLLNVVYGNRLGGSWPAADVAPIHAESWSAGADWCDRFKLEGSAHIGGTTERVALRQVVERWLASFPMFKLCWNGYGQLRLVNLAGAIDWPGYPGASAVRLHAESDQTERRTKVGMDVGQLARQLGAEHLFSAVDSQSYASLQVQDPAVVDRVTESMQMDWSLAKAV